MMTDTKLRKLVLAAKNGQKGITGRTPYKGPPAGRDAGFKKTLPARGDSWKESVVWD